MKEDLKEILVPLEANSEVVLKALSAFAGPQIGSGFVLVVDSEGRLCGVITDADFRKAMVRHGGTSFSAAEAMNPGFFSLADRDHSSARLADLFAGFSAAQWTTFNPLRAIPLLDERGRPEGLLEVTGREKEVFRPRDVAIVIGQGFVGSTLAAVLSNAGIRTLGVDSNHDVIDHLRRGSSVTKEEGLDEAIQGGLSNGKLDFFYSLDHLPTLESGKRQYFVVTVGTPLDPVSPNLDAVFSVVDEVAGCMKRGDVIVVRSTVPVGTSREVANIVEHKLGWRVGVDFYVANAPERTVEGRALRELDSLPQVIGGITTRCFYVARAIFEPFAPSVIEAPSAEFAELLKLSSNAFRDYSFAFSNFLAEVSSHYEIDVNQLIKFANLGYPRNQIAQPSPGVGGPCLTKDSYMFPPSAITEERRGSPVLAARRYNEDFLSFQAGRLIDKLAELGISAVAALGIAFKGVPETNDLRGSTGVDIARHLQSSGVEVHSWDAVVGGGAGGFSTITEGQKYQAVLLLNNHEGNAQKALGLLASVGRVLLYDPWRLINGRHWLFHSSDVSEQLTYMTLSSSNVD